MSGAGIEIRLLTVDDVDAICDVQRHAYAENYLESASSFVAKIAAAPATCFGAFSTSHDDAAANAQPVMLGYLICLPCEAGFTMPLDSEPTGVLPLDEASCVYVHDLAVRRDHRGHRLGHLLWEALCEVATSNGIVHLSLVSVQNSTAYWQARGFSVVGPAPVGYGDEAVTMNAAITY